MRHIDINKLDEVLSMREWRCKCGQTLWFGSDAPRECQTCPTCGTNAYGTEPPPHQPTTEETIRDGVSVKKRTYCKICMNRLDI